MTVSEQLLVLTFEAHSSVRGLKFISFLMANTYDFRSYVRVPVSRLTAKSNYLIYFTLNRTSHINFM